LAGFLKATGDIDMGIWNFLKNWLLDAKVSRDDVSNAFNYVLGTIDENGDEYISVRELIKFIKTYLKRND